MALRVYFNIRQKVMFGMLFSMVVIGAFAATSFVYLRELERKQHLVELADDLGNNILETRRYEKNFLLYGSPEDLTQNREYLGRGLESLERIVPETRDLKGAPLLNQLGIELRAYGELMDTVAKRESAGPLDSHLEEQLRERGKSIVQLSQALVTFERERILILVAALKTQLLSSTGLFIVLGAALIPLIAQKILTPLRVIERTTHRIAQGDFRPIPVLDTRDETQRVVEGFNRMIKELEERQDQLLQAKKLSSLGILTSGIAHQLNNPLNNISTSCQILIEELGGTGTDFSRKMLTNVEQEVHRARDIVRGLLEFSRVQEFRLVPSLLSEAVERSVSLMSSQLPPGVEVIREVPADLIIEMDPHRMQQVFLNLLMNAVHAIGDPPGQIRITGSHNPGQQFAVITIEDTGSGIAESDLGRIFDPFFTTKEIGVGTGLGLSIVYGTVRKHRGSISVESKPNEGTRFIIRLPMSQAATGDSK